MKLRDEEKLTDTTSTYFQIEVINAQDTICVSPTIQHTIESKHLNESRNYWVSLPLRYSDTVEYPVIYVLDAEWRFELVKHIVFDQGAWQNIQNSIVIGIPHVEWDKKRGQDMTFSQSRIEYDGTPVDSTWYNSGNSGHGMKFYNFFMQELIPHVNTTYSTNGHETLIGNSYGGYFGGYLLSMEHPFEVLHILDPAIWYSNGEVIERYKKVNYTQPTTIHVAYQPVPEFHKQKIEEFIAELKKNPDIKLTTELYPKQSHNGLFLDSFYKGLLITNK